MVRLELRLLREQQPEFPLRRRENPPSPLNWRAEKIRLSRDKSSLTYNDFLTLDGIPPETFEYRLGNRSALEWVIDQYQVSTDKRSGITNDPNRRDDLEYIVRLLNPGHHGKLGNGENGERFAVVGVVTDFQALVSPGIGAGSANSCRLFLTAETRRARRFRPCLSSLRSSRLCG